jgi:hypothetical protein
MDATHEYSHEDLEGILEETTKKLYTTEVRQDVKVQEIEIKVSKGADGKPRFSAMVAVSSR